MFRSRRLLSVVVDTIAFNVELICVAYSLVNLCYILITVYRPPGYTFDCSSHVDRLLLCLDLLINTSGNIIVAGDLYCYLGSKSSFAVKVVHYQYYLHMSKMVTHMDNLVFFAGKFLLPKNQDGRQ